MGTPTSEEVPKANEAEGSAEVDLRFCNNCQTLHPLSEFGIRRRFAEGYTTSCRKSIRLKVNNYLMRRPDVKAKIKARDRELHRLKRDLVAPNRRRYRTKYTEATPPFDPWM